MPLIKQDGSAVSKEAVQTAEANAAQDSENALQAEASVLEEPTVLDPEVPETAATPPRSTSTEVAPRAEGQVARGSQTAAMQEFEAAGFGGGQIDFTSFTNVVLKDGEFQLVGTTKSFAAKDGFDGVVLQSRAKWAMRVGNDDDADVAFAYDKADFNNVETEAGEKVAQWRAEKLKPELKEYAELFVMVSAVHAQECKELEGDAVVVQVSPMSIGRWAGYKFKQRSRLGGLMPDKYITRFIRGEKVTAAKFPFYPWDFKYVGLNE
jgi:hypothetical protein